MPELAIMAHDKIGVDIYADAKSYKRGDVVIAMPNGFAWGSEEKTNPLFRIVLVFDILLGDAQSFCATEPAVDPLNPSRTLQRRGFKLDVDAVALSVPGFAAYMADDSRASYRFVPATAIGAVILANKVMKAPIPDPALIGSSPTVIG